MEGLGLGLPQSGFAYVRERASPSGSIINYCGYLPESSIKLCLNEQLH